MFNFGFGKNKEWYLVAGLGNPEKKYDGTRHNAGFAVIDRLANKYQIPYAGTKYRAATGRGRIGMRDVVLAKPITYMNLSGEAIRPLADYYKVDTTTRLIVISDDTDLDVGVLRIRKKGSAGGHNGLKNIIQHLGHEDFIRLRVGVGRRSADGDQVSHVLSRIPKEEQEAFDLALDRAAEAVATIITDGADAAMNLFNRKQG